MILLCTSSAYAQYVEITCTNYAEISDNAYIADCVDYMIKFSDEREIVFLGNKPEYVANDKVTQIRFIHPSVPFFVNEIFVTFPNLQHLIIFGSLIVMHPYAFSSASNLESLILVTESLQLLPAYAFTGATKLSSIQFLGCNALIRADEAAFVGLDNLSNLEIFSTPLGTSPKDIFKPLINLIDVTLIGTGIKEIRPELFANNLKLKFIQIGDTNIDGVDRKFVDGLEKLKYIKIAVNCAEAIFDASSSSATLSQFQSEMEPCYSNYTVGLC